MATVVGLFRDMALAEQAINDLKAAGYDASRVGVVAKDQQAATDLATSTGVSDHAAGAAAGAVGGGIVGGIAGALLAGTTLLIPGIGPVLFGGILATTLGAAAAGAGVGAVTGGILGGLVGLGVPEEEARYYETAVGEGGTLVTVNAADDSDVGNIRSILNNAGAENIEQRGASTATGYSATTTTTNYSTTGSDYPAHSTTADTAGGAAAGAAAGALVGGPVGAVTGAVIGGATGATAGEVSKTNPPADPHAPADNMGADVAGGAATGAVAGAVIGGPVGAAAGAVIGGVTGAAGGAVAHNVNRDTAYTDTTYDTTRNTVDTTVHNAGYAVDNTVRNAGDAVGSTAHEVQKPLPDHEEVGGSIQETWGNVKRGVGEATGSEGLYESGQHDVAEGEMHRAKGEVRDEMGDSRS